MQHFTSEQLDESLEVFGGIAKTSHQEPRMESVPGRITYYRVKVYEVVRIMSAGAQSHGWVCGTFPKKEQAEAARTPLALGLTPYDLKRGTTLEELNALAEKLGSHSAASKQAHRVWAARYNPVVVREAEATTPYGCPRSALEAAGFEIIEECHLDCDHQWEEQPGEPPVDVCTRCGSVRR